MEPGPADMIIERADSRATGVKLSALLGNRLTNR
jgi:hypothetical protein